MQVSDDWYVSKWIKSVSDGFERLRSKVVITQFTSSELNQYLGY